jgi:hypothetical protein
MRGGCPLATAGWSPQGDLLRVWRGLWGQRCWCCRLFARHACRRARNGLDGGPVFAMLDRRVRRGNSSSGDPRIAARAWRRGPMRHERFIELRGRRKPADVLARASRDHLLRLAAERYLSGLSDRQAATMLLSKMTRYREGAWRRDRAEALCPARHQGRIEGLLWQALRTRDAIPAARTIRRALAGGFTRPN